MHLKEQIKNYYFERFDELPKDKQFHFASRLAAWQNDPRAISELERLAAYMAPSKAGLGPVLQSILISKPGRPYAYEQRRLYFQKYPELFGIHNALFRVRHLMVFYGIDARPQLTELAGQAAMEQLYDKLRTDQEAIRVLSRFAIDYLYLYEILFEKKRQFDPRELPAISQGYDLTDALQAHLFIYLCTHAVIADSNFYDREVPRERLELYQTMLRELEDLLNRRRDIKWDNQLEFLVAARICDFDPPLAARINGAVRQSLDPSGNFIIDRLNGSASAYLNSFAGSEHRNVLYIMSQSAYSPRPVSLR